MKIFENIKKIAGAFKLIKLFKFNLNNIINITLNTKINSNIRKIVFVILFFIIFIIYRQVISYNNLILKAL